MKSDKNKQMIELFIVIGIIAIILIIIGVLMIKYEVEGETNMAFNLSKVIVISTAEGMEKEGTKKKWDLDIHQNNDIYLYIDKNPEYKKQEVIQKVSIENIKITKAPKFGEVKIYMPNSTKGRMYDYSENYLVEDKLEYKGASKSDSKTLEIGNQGGEALLRISNMNIGEYSSNKDKQITHDGTLIKKLNLTGEDVKFSMAFTLMLYIDNKQYKADIELDLPCEDITESGTANLEKNDIIFKRIK